MTTRINYNLKDAKAEKTLLVLICRWKGLEKHEVKVSTGINVEVQTWDKEIQRCVISNKFNDRQNRASRKINKFLDSLNKEMNNIFVGNDPEVYNAGTTPEEYIKRSIKLYIDKLKGKEKEEAKKEQIRPLEYFEKYVSEMTSTINRTSGTFVSKRTQGNHSAVLTRFKKFFRDTSTPDLFSSFDKNFEMKFINWAYKKKNYSYNTIPASFSILKVWLNHAQSEGIYVNDDFKLYVSKAKDVDNIYLSDEEIKRIFELDISGLIASGVIDHKSDIEITRDLFVVACLTGLRYSDINNLDKGLFDIENKRITVLTEKTKEKVILPMAPPIETIYKKYDGKFPHLPHKSSVLRHLEELGRLALIDDEVLITENRGGKKISTKYLKYQLIKFHTARRSFATNMYLKHVPTITIMKLTGHTTESNFLKYIKVTKEQHASMAQSIIKDYYDKLYGNENLQ